MATIKGQNLRVLVGGSCIAAATSCQFHIAAQTADSATKDDTGDWGVNEVVGLTWDASCDALVLLEDTGTGGVLPDDLVALMVAKTSVTLLFDVTNGTNNRTATSSVLAKTGTAIISDIALNAPNRQNATYSVKFQGTGALS